MPGEELGRWSQQSMEDTLTRQRDVLGYDHPDTLRLAHNLAAGLRALGEHQQARQLDEDKLLVALRPQFRVEVYGPAPDDPVLGRPSCAVPGCDRSGWEYGLCGGHSLRWRSRSRPEFVGFLATRARSCTGASG